MKKPWNGLDMLEAMTVLLVSPAVIESIPSTAAQAREAFWKAFLLFASSGIVGFPLLRTESVFLYLEVRTPIQQCKQHLNMVTLEHKVCLQK